MATKLSRGQLLERISQLAGPEIVIVEGAGSGWPGIIRVRLGGTWLRAAAHVAPIGLSHRGRDDVERRFQNPGKNKPMSAPARAVPLLLGLWEEQGRPVLVGMETVQRLGKPTRQSLFVPLWLLGQARQVGWAEHVSATGERITAFHPELLSVYAAMRKDDLSIPAAQVAGLVAAAGLESEEVLPPAERARRATMELLRDQRFRKRVLEAYSGLCAMCGLDIELVQAAHIYPVQAPVSRDEVWNGLALCGNHHSAFDRHYLWVDPTSKAILLQPSLQDEAQRSAVVRAFVTTTFSRLAEPRRSHASPRAEMFEKRYDFYDGKYSWAAA